MKTPKLGLPKTRLTFPLPIFVLAAIFFISYYFYYIPVNKQDIYKNGFIILENIKKSIQEKNEGIRMMCKSYLDPESQTNESAATTRAIQALLDKNNVTGKAFITNQSSSVFKRTLSADSFIIENAPNDIILKDIVNGNLIYLPTNSRTDSVGIAVPFESIVKPILQPQKNELFESYLVTDKNGLIYKDPEVGIGEAIFQDSLFANNKVSTFATVKDINIEGIPYKMFSYPLHLGDDEIVLCGFIKTKIYNIRLNEIPVSFIYPIVIIFILLIIFLPLIKFYIMGSDEHIKFPDIALGSLSFFIGAPLITLTLIQVLMLWSADIRAKENLRLVSAQIDSGFRKELTVAYQQLDFLDMFITNALNPATKQNIKTGTKVDVTDSIKNYYLTTKKDTALYYNFDRIAWVNQLGKQTIKAQITGADPVFLDVSARKYYKTIKDNEAYMLPDHPGSTFAFEPLNNWINGDFRMVISKPSHFDKDYVASLSLQLFSVTGTVLPPGYGFCIIDNTGEVQFHSEMNRNLQENIIEKISPSRQIKEAITSRQENYFSQVKFYGKTNALHIEPISKIPFYLITFYDKGYIVPINMRVFTFSLLFCFFTFLICTLIWVFVFRNRYYSYPMLYSPMAYLKWLIPRKSAAEFYTIGARLLLAYIVMLVFFIILAQHFHLSNYVILVLVLLFPVNVISGLFVLSYSTARYIKENSIREDKIKQKIKRRSYKAITAIFFHVALSGLAYLYSWVKGYPIGQAFIFFQLLFNCMMWLNYFSPRGVLSILSKSIMSYLTEFTWLALLLIISIAVLPAGLYTWYAHNQEITQSLKKEQLYLAESLQKRKGQINKLISGRDTLNPPANYYKQILYHSGIYKIYKDSIIERAEQPDTCPKKDSYEKFYFTIANDIGNNYYDPLLLPALQDSVKDNAWYWCRDNDTTLSLWYNLDPEMFEKSAGTRNQSLKIVSVYPARYKYYELSIRGILLALFVIGLLWGLFVLLSSLTQRIFLKKYIFITNNTPPSEKAIVDLFQQYNKVSYNAFSELESEINKLKDEYNIYAPGGDKPAVHIQEKQMIDTLQRLKGFYEFVWQKCADKEKYLLLDFAHDGLANYKNTAVIYHLLKTGILIIYDDDIKLFSASFRAFLITKKNTTEIAALQTTFRQNSTWQSFRRPLLVILLGIALFIFFTQEQTFQKILALVAGISSVSSLLMKFFVDGASAGELKK